MILKIITLALSLVFGIQTAFAQAVVTVVMCESDQLALSDSQLIFSSSILSGFKFGIGETSFEKPIIEVGESALTSCVEQIQTLITQGNKAAQRRGPQACIAITFENGQVVRSEDGTRDVIGQFDGSFEDDHLKRRVKCVSATSRKLAYDTSRLFLWGRDL